MGKKGKRACQRIGGAGFFSISGGKRETSGQVNKEPKGQAASDQERRQNTGYRKRKAGGTRQKVGAEIPRLLRDRKQKAESRGEHY